MEKENGTTNTGNSIVQVEIQVVDRPLEIDDECDVRWKTGDQVLPAKVIERRPLNRRKRKNKRELMVDGLLPDEIEYYIHYVGHDRYVHTLYL